MSTYQWGIRKITENIVFVFTCFAKKLVFYDGLKIFVSFNSNVNNFALLMGYIVWCYKCVTLKLYDINPKSCSFNGENI